MLMLMLMLFMLILMMLLMLLATQVGSICIVEHFRNIAVEIDDSHAL